MSRRAPLRRLASGRRAAVGQRRRGLATNSSSSGLRQSWLGRARGRCSGRAPPGPGGVPEPEQEGRQGTEIRQVRASAVSRQRDAAGCRRDPGEHLPDRAAAAQETLLTEDRAARQALQAVLPHRQDPGSRRERFRVGP